MRATQKQNKQEKQQTTKAKTRNRKQTGPTLSFINTCWHPSKPHKAILSDRFVQVLHKATIARTKTSSLGSLNVSNTSPREPQFFEQTEWRKTSFAQSTSTFQQDFRWLFRKHGKSLNAVDTVHLRHANRIDYEQIIE